ncbi:LysM peptidoglycan-binding domain-containing protein [Gallaecimonas sp. GXIMD4217]|uniref:LysM peptidoglycan-binding domain-containing protein n=1 Tax=Gallaecimonas sp. GXIMD4217 TaxID=3131927 RepID=UPI00311ADA6A
MRKPLLALVAACLTWLAVAADELKLKNDFPEVYVVQKGDTLWDISAKYLQNPWLWPKLWQSNTEVDNPHLIYPGDKLSLVIVDGVPQLVRKPMVKLSPTARVVDKGDAIPTLPVNHVREFLTHQKILDDDMLKLAPVVLGNIERTTRMDTSNNIYARGDDLKVGKLYGVYRQGNRYVDPNTGEFLGSEAILVAVAKAHEVEAITLGDAEDARHTGLATLEITQVEREVAQGDRLLPLDNSDSLPVYFTLKAPGALVDAVIIDSSRKTRALGKYDVVVLSKGARDGMEVGHVLDARRVGAKVLIKDDVEYEESASRFDRWFSSDEQVVRQPTESIGQMMVFRTFDKLSLALIMKAEKPIREGDQATNPQ